jgi:hypothetical protein
MMQTAELSLESIGVDLFRNPGTQGALDYGHYQVLFRPVKARRYRKGPTVPYCTAAGGSFTDTAGAVWTVSQGRVMCRDGRHVAGGDHVATAMLVNDVVYYQGIGTLWYRYSAGRWIGPQMHSPLTAPGVVIDGLRPRTEYEITVTVCNSVGFGPAVAPIIQGTARVR